MKVAYRKSSQLLICLILVCADVSAQETARQDTPATKTSGLQCTKTLAESPTLRGLRLGMTSDTVKTFLPSLTFGIPMPDKVQPAWANAVSFSSPLPEFKDISDVYLFFWDKRVIYIAMDYNSISEAKSNEEFVARLSKVMGLTGEWQDIELAHLTSDKIPKIIKYKGKRLECNGFSIKAGLYLKQYPSIELRDTAASEILNERKKQREEQERQNKSLDNFKP
ncbi:MAG TPA: hypothetical protein VGC66_17780 [Pyrinomonadaceae bacterium]|jgi:hypothetical protein